MPAFKALKSLSIFAFLIAAFMTGTSARADQEITPEKATHQCHLFVGDIYDQDCDLSGCTSNNKVDFIKVIVFDRTADRTLFEGYFTVNFDINNSPVDQIEKQFSQTCAVYDTY